MAKTDIRLIDYHGMTRVPFLGTPLGCWAYNRHANQYPRPGDCGGRIFFLDLYCAVKGKTYHQSCCPICRRLRAEARKGTSHA